VRYVVTVAACFALMATVVALVDGVGYSPEPAPLQLDDGGSAEAREAGSEHTSRPIRRRDRARAAPVTEDSGGDAARESGAPEGSGAPAAPPVTAPSPPAPDRARRAPERSRSTPAPPAPAPTAQPAPAPPPPAAPPPDDDDDDDDQGGDDDDDGDDGDDD
jgi:hypothetical protein